MNSLYEVPAPAKVNLFLHIVGRRDDGYHDLQSVFMLIDWCDHLHFERLDSGTIERVDTTPADLPEDDLCVRAARALRQATGCTHGVRITLDKRLPAQAGLGGGSSDAATTLLALNRLWDLNLRRDALARIGLTLGADVPFFIGGRHAWVEGIGERLTPIELPRGHLVLVKPPGGASTPQIFASQALKRDTKTATIQGFAANGTLESLMAFGHNDLEPVARALCPEVGDAIHWLADQGLAGRMTGSGTAVFAPCAANQVLSPAPASWQVRVCSNMDAHPLLDWCDG
ncbi:MAG: 4-(cytidine 5'-diphospho)-2-C-methyl-D-erythritol kinase [Hydrogenophaga sp.]|uniref:4-(cytidine 5'-diphospho)-2-C-methyl-D-erythritol kinase n=1 Tax=Hydrogenophaga sp. TaxID=1904254 RepID=UPI0016A1D050|nr:4-(cytidine 5'-diphospho)-2-C-methyl-D-erythritol kinase [Hydrogenophaga sp.]NIM42714.1 4-(cytidine 5'-diphospho)-2-C-methyl-D-erythritol kinase [Hydrogenophaga sp.]NIN25757.1 4-(cytidine 5'-diphospho)-2-C-methyl-D-erythritol kinase [Hydrogenophaga sp.]NIN30419.1 4-(cytidine 5'-diphospho)-2-C-methyl-D-erythritol kinase [Hydrogenophaga sp.]NIN56759.1 4-(cytidine 5'-diphospho)-2-C-methyl-D-erythritol kinase [Hydrogenophaga sp.]NIO53334.1 4-(cytidine 5'-diphospho)-2-C-methyl-D-erythritol kinas